MNLHSGIGRLTATLARKLDYTDVRKEITYSDLERLCFEAAAFGVGAVVIPSILVGRAATCLRATTTAVSCFVGYPFGTQAASVKATEAEEAVRQGAKELEVVPHFGSLLAGDWDAVTAELRAVRRASGAVTLKLALEASRLSSAHTEWVCAAAAEAGFAFVSNSLGFRIVSTQPISGPQVTGEVVRKLRHVCGDVVKVKAVGAGDTSAQIGCLIEAGAERVAVQARPGWLRALAAGEEGIAT